MNNLKAPYCFVKLLQHGTFTGAARALNVPLSTLSREIAALERESLNTLFFIEARDSFDPPMLGRTTLKGGVRSSNRLISRTRPSKKV
jgi:DNA-binding transcriptional LysR family regulator